MGDISYTLKVDGDISQLQARLDQLKSKKLQLNVDLSQAKADIQSLKNSISNIKLTLLLDRKSLSKDEIKELEKELETLKTRLGQLKESRLKIETNIAQVSKETYEVKNALDSVTPSAEGVSEALGEIGSTASSAMDKANTSVRSLSDVLNDVGNSLSNIGSAVSNFSGLIGGDALYSGISNIASSLGNYLTSNIDDAVERYDILTTFPQYMSLIGASAEDSNYQLNKMYEAVKGTKVDYADLVSDAQKYSMILGDVNLGSNLATVVDKLSALGGSDASTRWRYALQRVLTTGEVSTETSWLSIINGLGAGGKILAEQFEETDGSVQDLSNQLVDGSISAQRFLDVLENMADSEGLEALTKISQQTISGKFTQLKQTVTQGETTVISAIQQQLGEQNTSIQDIIDEAITFTTDSFQDLGTYIGQHPEIITNFMSGVKEIVSGVSDAIKEIGKLDIGGAIKNVLGGLKEQLSVITSVISYFPTDVWSKIIVWGPIAGKAISALGTFFKTLSTISSVLPSIGVFSKIKSVFSKIKSVFSKTGELTEAVETASTGLSSFKSIGQGLILAGGSIAVLAELGATIKLYVSTMQDIANLDLDTSGNFGEKMGAVATYITVSGAAVAGIITAFTALGSSTGGVGFGAIGLGELLAAGFLAELDLLADAIKRFTEGLKNIAEALDLVGDVDAGTLANKAETLTDIATTILTSFSGFNVPVGADNFDDFTAGITTILEFVPTLQDMNLDLQKAAEQAEKISSEGGIADSLQKIFDAFTKVVEDMKSKQKELSRKYGDEGLISYTWKSLFGGNASSVDIAEEMSNLSTIMDGIQNAIQKISEITTMDLPDEIPQEKIDNITKLGESITKLINAFTGSTTEGSNTNANIGSRFDFLQEVENAVGTLESTINKISELSVTMSSISISTDFTFVDNLRSMIDAFKPIVQDYSIDYATLEWQIGMIESCINKISELSNTASSIGDMSAVTDAINNFKTAMSQFVGFNQGENSVDFAALETQIEQVKKCINEMSDAIAVMSSTTYVGNVGGLADSFATVGTQAEMAKDKVKELKSALDDLPDEHKIIITADASSALGTISYVKEQLNSINDKTVTVSIAQQITETVSRYVTETSGSQSTGGLVPEHYATGGFVRFIPKGTDTVPAMLTPGEYVIRKGVASVLGKSVLDKINNMDFVGAMASMGMNKLYNTYNNTNVHNTTNNRSANVVQNIYNQSESYSYTRAGKFVERLASL